MLAAFLRMPPSLVSCFNSLDFACSLPSTTRPSCLVLFATPADGREPIAWAGMQLFGYAKQLGAGQRVLKLWPGACPTPLATHLDNAYGE